MERQAKDLVPFSTTTDDSALYFTPFQENKIREAAARSSLLISPKPPKQETKHDQSPKLNFPKTNCKTTSTHSTHTWSMSPSATTHNVIMMIMFLNPGQVGCHALLIHGGYTVRPAHRAGKGVLQ